jgi:hypothetical protein
VSSGGVPPNYDGRDGTEDTRGLAVQYYETLIAHSENRPRPAKANRLFKKIHQLYKQLRESEEGRAAISALLTDQSVDVRLGAATHSLFWGREDAEAVLEEIAKMGDKDQRINATMVLMQFRAGHLNLDW